MVVKDEAKSWVTDVISPRTLAKLEFDEQCSLCDRYIPNASLILRHVESKHILCGVCLNEIADLV